MGSCCDWSFRNFHGALSFIVGIELAQLGRHRFQCKLHIQLYVIPIVFLSETLYFITFLLFQCNLRNSYKKTAVKQLYENRYHISYLPIKWNNFVTISTSDPFSNLLKECGYAFEVQNARERNITLFSRCSIQQRKGHTQKATKKAAEVFYHVFYSLKLLKNRIFIREVN